MTKETEVAGIRCSQVLERLSEYVDGELDEQTVQNVNLHLDGCDRCAKFGSEFSALLGRVRSGLKPEGELSKDAAARLDDRLSSLLAK